MKTKFKFNAIAMFFVMALCSLIGVQYSMAVGAGVPIDLPNSVTDTSTPGLDGAGNFITGDQPITSEVAAAADPTLLLTAFDKEVVKFKPHKTPLDTLFRYASQRPVKSLQVKWVSVDTLPFTATVTTAHTQSDPITSADGSVDLVVSNANAFAKSQTILVPTVLGWNSAGVRETDIPLMLYVKKKSGATLTVMAVNGGPIVGESNLRYVPTIAKDTVLYRQGRAAQEKDVQTDNLAGFTTTEENYLQAFKCQVEESYWYRKMDKLIDWTMEDQKEMAILNWKMEMEASYLNGVKGSVYDDEKQGMVYMCNGITRYITKEFEYSSTGWTADDFVDLTKAAFVGNSGSAKRVLLMGSDLMATISKVDLTLHRDITKSAEAHWGIEFTTFRTNFGVVLCLHHELMDDNNMSDKGILIDPNYLFKFVFEAQNSQEIDNKKMGTSNTVADVTTEVSCPGLKYPNCHLIVKPA